MFTMIMRFHKEMVGMTFYEHSPCHISTDTNEILAHDIVHQRVYVPLFTLGAWLPFMQNPLSNKPSLPSRILLADDDADDRELFEEALSDIHPAAVLTTAQNGEELMYILKNYHKPDLLFLDLNMPRKNGKECLHEIAKHPELKKIPIVIFSTSVNPTDIEETFSLGAMLFFRKPNSYEELKRNVAEIFSEKLATPRTKESFLISTHTSNQFL